MWFGLHAIICACILHMKPNQMLFYSDFLLSDDGCWLCAYVIALRVIYFPLCFPIQWNYLILLCPLVHFHVNKFHLMLELWPIVFACPHLMDENLNDHHEMADVYLCECSLKFSKKTPYSNWQSIKEDLPCLSISQALITREISLCIVWLYWKFLMRFKWKAVKKFSMSIVGLRCFFFLAWCHVRVSHSTMHKLIGIWRNGHANVWCFFLSPISYSSIFSSFWMYALVSYSLYMWLNCMCFGFKLHDENPHWLTCFLLHRFECKRNEQQVYS